MTSSTLALQSAIEEGGVLEQLPYQDAELNFDFDQTLGHGKALINRADGAIGAPPFAQLCCVTNRNLINNPMSHDPAEVGVSGNYEY